MPLQPPEAARPYRTVTVEPRSDGVVVMSFFVPDHGQNVLTSQAVSELAAVLDSLETGPAPAAVVLCSTREGSFFAGADMARLERLHEASPAEIEGLCACRSPDILAALFPALAERGDHRWPLPRRWPRTRPRLRPADRHRRQPYIPRIPRGETGTASGLGGTVRLARLIGPGAAVELAAAGETVDGLTAARLGLVDACVPPDQALASACRLAEIASARQSHLERRRQQAGSVTLAAEERDFLEAMSAAVILGRSGGQYPAPLAILETILAGAATTADEAAICEAAAFASLAKSDVSRQLIRVFRLGERNRRDKGLDGQGLGEGSPTAGPGSRPTDRKRGRSIRPHGTVRP